MEANLESAEYIVISDSGSEEGRLNGVTMEVAGPVSPDQYDLDAKRSYTHSFQQTGTQDKQESMNQMLTPSTQVSDGFDKFQEKTESSFQADTNRSLSTNRNNVKDVDGNGATSRPTTKGGDILVLRNRTLRLPPSEKDLKSEEHGSLNRQKPKKRTEIMSTTTLTETESTSLNNTRLSEDASSHIPVTNDATDRLTSDIKDNTMNNYSSDPIVVFPPSPSVDVLGLSEHKKEETPHPSTYALPEGRDDEFELDPIEAMLQQSVKTEHVECSLIEEKHQQRQNHDYFQQKHEWDLEDADLKDEVTQRATVTIKAKCWGILKKNSNLYKNISKNVKISCCKESTENIVTGAWTDVDAVVSLVAEAYRSNVLQSTLTSVPERYNQKGALSDTASETSQYDLKPKVCMPETSSHMQGLEIQSSMTDDSADRKEGVRKEVIWTDIQPKLKIQNDHTVSIPKPSYEPTERNESLRKELVCTEIQPGFKMQTDRVQSSIPKSSYDLTERAERLREVGEYTESRSPGYRANTKDFNHVQRNNVEDSISSHQEGKGRGNVEEMLAKEHIQSRETSTRNEQDMEVDASETSISTNEAYQKPMKKSSRRHNRTFNNCTLKYEQNQLAGNAIINAKQGLVIHIQKGDILTLKDTDWIIICTDEKLSSQTGLAGALKFAAGDSYRKECEKKSVPRNGCTITEAGNLWFKKILHVVLSSWKACHTQPSYKKLIDELKAVLAKAFQQANKNSMQSIAIPAIGTGHLAYPTEIWISAVVEVIVDYNKDPKFTKQSLKKICFVDQNVELLVSLGKALRVQFPQASPVTDISLSGTDRNTFRVTDSFSIKVVQDSITRFVGDAIAITDDPDKSGWGSLAKSASRAAGESYTKEKRSANFVDGIFLTGAGKISCGKIVHGMLGDYPDTKEIGRVVWRILNKANEKEMTKIALPLIGTGSYGVSVADVCNIIVKVIWDFPVDFPNTTLREVCVMDIVGSKIDMIVGELTKLKSTKTSGGVDSSASKMFGDAGQPTKDTRDSAASISAPSSCDNCRDGTKMKSYEACGHGICSSCIIPVIESCIVCWRNSLKDESERGAAAVNKYTVQDQEDQCSICLGDFTEPKTLPCGHVFCRVCIDRWFDQGNKVCALCKAVCGRITGNQPPGNMVHNVDKYLMCDGYGNCGSIAISYSFSGGTQDNSHPNPGSPYYSTRRTAYLPDNVEGRKVLRLLYKAFDQGLTFTIGTSVTTRLRNAITWNDIHHKTSRWGGPAKFGYPDPTYLTRVQEELKAKGITDDQQQNGRAV